MTIVKTDNVGTDYDPDHATNRRLVMTKEGTETIHFGVINQNCEELEEGFHDEIDNIYTAHCPLCQCRLDPDDLDCAIDDIEECPECKRDITGYDDYWDDEPSARIMRCGGYEGTLDSYGDLVLHLSKYYTNAQFCSPCVPGAGHLENPCEEGPKTFCLGHEWFKNETAPYPVYDVETGKLMDPVKEDQHEGNGMDHQQSQARDERRGTAD